MGGDALAVSDTAKGLVRQRKQLEDNLITLLGKDLNQALNVNVAGAVKNFEGLTREKIAELKERYNEGIGAGERYWRSKADCRFGFLVWLEEVKAIEPVRVAKRDWRGWVVLTEQEDFGLIKAAGLEKV